MQKDFLHLDPQKRGLAEKIYSDLKEYEKAYTCRTDSADESIEGSGRERITGLLEELAEVSLEQQIEISALSDGEWLCTSYRILSETTDPFVPKNQFDNEFFLLIDIFRKTSSEGLFEALKQSMYDMKKRNEGDYRIFVEYFAKFPLWGTLDPQNQDFDTLKRRAAVLKHHSYDFVWLFRRLSDYLSKRTLFAILLNWAVIDMAMLGKVKSIFPDYFEPDIFPDNKDDVFVDVGAYIGDTVYNYISNYGYDYKKIYAYEISPKSCENMRKNFAGLEKLHDCEIRCKGAGSAAGELFLSESEFDQSANQLSQAEKSGGQRIEVAALDDELPDGFTFLKMDIEGAEYEALKGSRRNICTYRPKLAICTYHGYDDIWRIPALIDRYNPDYKFYMRYNGGNLIPTEFVLLAKDQRFTDHF